MCAVTEVAVFEDEQVRRLVRSRNVIAMKADITEWNPQIFQDGTDDLLGEAELFAAGQALVGSDSVEIDTDSVRIRTYGLVLGGNSTSFQSFFNEFETTAVPEPTTATVIVLLGVAVVARRRR